MIRKANLSDINQIAILNKTVQKIHHKSQPEIFKPYSAGKSLKAFKIFLTKKNFTILVYIDDVGKFKGYVLYEKKISVGNFLLWPYRKLYVHHISVSKDVQDTGIGKELISAVVKNAKATGIKRIELDVWAFNAKAKVFFRKCGFEVFNEKMALDIA